MTMTDTILSRGGIIIPATHAGRPWRTISPEIEIRDRDTLAAWYRRGTRRFIFRPIDAGLVALDLDMKNGKNGVREFIEITGTDPREAYHVETPSGGVHVYFRNTSGADFVSCELRDHPGIEIKHRAFITLAGSISDRGRYIPHGDAEEIQALPAALRDVMPVRRSDPAPMPRHTGEALALRKIYDVLIKQGLTPTEGTRNRFSFELARFARRQGHRPDAVQGFLSFLASGNFTSYEIRSAVNSAYRGAR